MSKKYLSITLSLLTVLATIISGCTKMEEIHEEYIADGETVYSVKVDNPIVYPGNERVQLKGYLKNALQVKTITISWANEDNTITSKSFDYDYHQSPDSFLVGFQLSEGQYLFTITSENVTGNKSIPADAFSKVYGPKYISYLGNREISSMVPNITGGVKFTFASAALNHTGTKIEYKTIDGPPKNIMLPPSQNELILEDVDLFSTLSFSSGYLPEEMSIDTLYANARIIDLKPLTEISFEFDKSSWEIVDFSSEEQAANEGGGNGPAANIIDGRNSSYWQSEWSAQTAQLPHHITIDMKREFNVMNIDLYRRSGTNHTKTVSIEGSSDGSTWEDLGILSYSDNAGESKQELEITDGKRIRFIKLNVTESNVPPYVSLAEIVVVGKL
ncbi:hypothetical protein D1614_21655 [Maribellus luteus]|uniref:F5/8 type C domain-containing protein n=1 Tax=Maribellus luteus TaxID=2305463 RepID=A0A399SP08_9BACT|nr:DUF4998 domain-containing protein [Maribellus luteus]RIJ45746.1 hypothetical protein D1614_21655 [Maribellus luteus]